MEVFKSTHLFCLTSNLKKYNKHKNVSINLKIELNVLKARLCLGPKYLIFYVC